MDQGKGAEMEWFVFLQGPGRAQRNAQQREISMSRAWKPKAGVQALWQHLLPSLARRSQRISGSLATITQLCRKTVLHLALQSGC